VKIETLSVHIGREVEADSGAVAPSIHLSTTFERDPDGSFSRGFSYARPNNPTRDALEQCLAALEGGAEALAFGSGSAASLAAFSLLRAGDHVIAPRECYHGTAKQLRDIVVGWGVSVDFVDMTSAAAVAAALCERTRMIWIETPSNPLLNVTDIERCVALGHGAGALVCCDNTFATPLWQRPLALGADLVMHSTTKYFGGHSDLMGGALIAREQGPVLRHLRDYQATAGAVPSAFDCWLVRRSLTTFPWRMRAQTDNALALVEFLRKDPRVERVFYPGLPEHPGHAVASRQMSGFGAMISICVRGGRNEAFAVAARTRFFKRATSLGGVESLIEHRASVEGPDTASPENLLRLSIGLEHPDDLIADLSAALG
jgi:cystathionine gamma-synthase